MESLIQRVFLFCINFLCHLLNQDFDCVSIQRLESLIDLPECWDLIKNFSWVWWPCFCFNLIFFICSLISDYVCVTTCERLDLFNTHIHDCLVLPEDSNYSLFRDSEFFNYKVVI